MQRSTQQTLPCHASRQLTSQHLIPPPADSGWQQLNHCHSMIRPAACKEYKGIKSIFRDLIRHEAHSLKPAIPSTPGCVTMGHWVDPQPANKHCCRLPLRAQILHTPRHPTRACQGCRGAAVPTTETMQGKHKVLCHNISGSAWVANLQPPQHNSACPPAPTGRWEQPQPGSTASGWPAHSRSWQG